MTVTIRASLLLARRVRTAASRRTAMILAIATLSAVATPLSAQQAVTCSTAKPFCTGTLYTFPASTNTTAEVGPNYGCLGSEPNPAWYYLKIKTAGSLTIGISQEDSNHVPQDVDYILWGPFTSPTAPCTAQLTAANTVGCSHSSSPTETATIPSAQV